MLSEPVPFLRNPLSQNLQELLIRYTAPPYHIPNQKHTVSYFTSRTLISEPPTFLTREWGTRVLRKGVPAFYDENDDDVDDVDVDDDDDDGAITTK
jgi:hypothetical protein